MHIRYIHSMTMSCKQATSGGLQLINRINTVRKIAQTTQDFILDEVIFQKDKHQHQKSSSKEFRKNKTDEDIEPITSVLEHHLSLTFV